MTTTPNTGVQQIAAPEDPFDRRLALAATGLLAEFNRAGILDAADVHVATRLCALRPAAGSPVGSASVGGVGASGASVGGAGVKPGPAADNPAESDQLVALAVALAARAVRNGSVCVDLATVHQDSPEGLAWPDRHGWLAAIQASPLLASDMPVLRLYRENLLYLDRYWREEEQVCRDLLDRVGPGPGADESGSTAIESGLTRVFYRDGSDEQREAARIALNQATTVLTGGPGTGKTTTVAGLLALLVEQAEAAGRPRPRIALAAPTGKASARLQQAVAAEVALLDDADRDRLPELRAVTLHRLLGVRPDSSVRFRHHRGNRLPHDVIVVDETSMVSLTMMARLLEAVRPEARLILVGDADQLTSVEAGAVLADLVDGLGARPDTRIAKLLTSHRFGSDIGDLAAAIRAGDAASTLSLLRGGSPSIEFVEVTDPDDPVSTGVEPAAALRDVLLPHALAVREAALSGADPDTADRDALAVLDGHRLLCAHREGPFGVYHWNRQVERWLSDATGENLWAHWYAGRPILVTANDYGVGLYNGDTGVTVARDGILRAVIETDTGPKTFATSRLSDVETMHAMTIHKSQGSQAAEVTVLLPSAQSRLLTRELFYTAVTRAKEKVRVVGTEAGVRAALERRVIRASGLRYRLVE
ncbi:MAG: exodeoxyribonuclease V subunit alpha [Mycolicibacterium sp.]|nr:exodeoxyribonuclease V subunit alpha [Mycolicibacterium sp.]